MTVPIILAVGAIVVVAVVMGIVLARQKDPQRRATALKRTGAAIMALFTALGVMFVAGYALDDPGGTAGLLMTLTWVAPLLILAALAWFSACRRLSPADRTDSGLRSCLRMVRARPSGSAQLDGGQRARARGRCPRPGIPGGRTRPQEDAPRGVAAVGPERAAARDHFGCEVGAGRIAHGGRRRPVDHGRHLPARGADGTSRCCRGRRTPAGQRRNGNRARIECPAASGP